MAKSTSKGHTVTSFGIDTGGGVLRFVKSLREVTDYDDRDGYDPAFLGKEAKVALPKLSAARRKDAAPVKGGGIELKYHHFSVVQSKSRKMCYFSICNIDGATSTKSARTDVWRYDPRVSTDYQLIDECYGNAKDGMFSRGHMTRREDPVWGAEKKVAEEDTFHAPNAVPQMQGHNSPVWLALEDHVLRNADKDNQKVTVITGPVLSKQDPTLYDVKVPVRLWKIVAFLRPKTAMLASVAYLDSQAEFLPEAGGPSFVWGQFNGMQVPVSKIQQLTGLQFGPLAKADVLLGADDSFAMTVTKVTDILLS